MESLRWSVMIVSMAPRDRLAIRGPQNHWPGSRAFGLVTALAWAWWECQRRLPEPGAEAGADGGAESEALEITDSTA